MLMTELVDLKKCFQNWCTDFDSGGYVETLFSDTFKFYTVFE